MEKNKNEEKKVENSKLAVIIYILLLVIFYLFYRNLEFTTGISVLDIFIDLVIIISAAIVLNRIVFLVFKKIL